MDKNLICIVFVMFAGCSAPQEGAQTPTAEPYPQDEEAVAEHEPAKVDAETKAAFEEAYRRHPPSPMLPSLNRDR